eukprot:gnl/MRDRNA2_/MRDRNA2_29262_c0_seq1.p1 gnl/MRDRNA2_/MRDRNA2_29262_c0~~gnl/MRDRNA2_/MRDRNA2_29262_c0_seq1.p1  ORF type:complete len:182 (-),score=33.84 gnl/MRDRNA2_/MRDRNA2_29262_c0_seq1:380-925(-)
MFRPGAFFRSNSITAKKPERSQKYLPKVNPNKEECKPRRALETRGLEAVKKMKGKSVVSGCLRNQEKVFMGFEKTWRERFVVLNPKLGNLAYWDVKTARNTRQAENSIPLGDYPLEDLMSIEVNEYHFTLMLSFCKPGSPTQIGNALSLQADCDEDFDQWVEALSSYGMKDTARPVAACAA